MKIVVESIEQNIVKLEISEKGKIYFEYEKLENFEKNIKEGDILKKTKSGYIMQTQKTENIKTKNQKKLDDLNKISEKIINL